MTIKVGYLVDISSLKFADGSAETWIQALPIGEYEHPVYGSIKVTSERVTRFADNVNKGVRTQQLDIDYDHKQYHGEAAGWVKKADARIDGLWVLVEWTQSALTKLKEKAYKYFSPEFLDEWTHPKTKQTFQDVLCGGGITNRPFLKDILPINLSEIFADRGVTIDGGKEMTPEQLAAIAEKLGLPKDATAEQVSGALLAHFASLDGASGADSDTEKPETETGADTAGAAMGAPSPAAVAASEISADVRKLAEENPAVKHLMDIIEMQGTQLADHAKKLRETEIDQTILKLNESATKKGYALPPTTTNALREALAASPSKQFNDKVVQAFSKLVDTGLVQLGEIGHSRGTQGDKTATMKFNDAVVAHQKTANVSYADAVVAVSAANPELFEEYRAESTNVG